MKLLLATLAATLVACSPAPSPAPTPAAAAPPTAPAVEMRAYDVPQTLAGELANVINRQLYRAKDEAPLGRANVGPGGRLLVTAPAGVLAGVEGLLKRLEATPPTPPPVVELTYWAVAATPGGEGPVPSSFREVAPALDAIVRAEGPRTFELIEKVAVRQVSGSEASVSGRELSVRQSASERAGTVVADVRLKRTRGFGEIQTQVALPTGKLLVLGQAGAEPGLEDGPARSVYFVVRAAVVGAGG